MEIKTIQELEEKYDLELGKIILAIKKNKAKLVLLQFADGIKPYAVVLADYLRENTKAKFLIWLGSCFGVCDTPVLGKELEKKIDLVIQFGHNKLLPQY